MLTFTLAISCLTTSNLPWFIDLTFQVPMQYCSVQHQTLLLSPVISTLGIVFALAPSLHSLSRVISPLISSSILGTYWPGEFFFQYPIILPFHTVHGVLKARILKWFSSVQFSRSVMSDSLQPHESQHARPPCPSPTPGVHSDSHTLSQWCHPAISSSVVPFSSCPQSLPASGS